MTYVAERALDILPSATSSSEDFDFFHGEWNVVNRKLKKRLQNCDQWLEFESTCECRPILHGLGNVDKFAAEIDSRPFEGIALRLFDPKKRLWSIYWADSNVAILDVPQVGSFSADTGVFLARDIWEGTPVIVEYNWNKNDPDRPVWSQAFSPDEGETWEWNWFMRFTRVPKNG